MSFTSRSCARRALVMAVGFLVALAARPALSDVDVRFERLDGFAAPGTPAELNKVGVLEIGPKRAQNILVLNPGTSASAAYFAPLAKTVVEKAKGWQVWAVERRENLLEDHSVLDQAKDGTVDGQELFDYYLGWLTDPSITNHFQFIPDTDVAFARDWGMNVEIEDLRRVVKLAQKGGRKVVVGGHSLGGSITTAYATWDFDGEPGARGLSGLVFIDGGSSPTPITPEQATQSLQALQAASPWLSFGGIPAPFAGLFNATGALGALIDPDSPSLGQALPLLPANLKPPIRVTNLGQYGYALDTETSPPEPDRRAGAPRPPRRERRSARLGPGGRDHADPALRGDVLRQGLKSLDGTAWYHPQRLTIDAGAVAAGNANPAQDILDVHATHGHDLPKRLRIYAFGAALGGQRVLDAATIARQPVEHPLAQPDADRPARDVRPQRPQLREPAERLRRRPGALPGEDQARPLIGDGAGGPIRAWAAGVSCGTPGAWTSHSSSSSRTTEVRSRTPTTWRTSVASRSWRSRSASTRCSSSSTTSSTTRPVRTTRSSSPGWPERPSASGSAPAPSSCRGTIPLRVAEKIVLLDHLSNGRAVLGLGRGLARREYAGFGVDMAESRDRFDEAARLILDATDRGYMEGDGPFYPRARTDIRPASPARLPRSALRHRHVARLRRAGGAAGRAPGDLLAAARGTSGRPRRSPPTSACGVRTTRRRRLLRSPAISCTARPPTRKPKRSRASTWPSTTCRSSTTTSCWRGTSRVCVATRCTRAPPRCCRASGARIRRRCTSRCRAGERRRPSCASSRSAASSSAISS